MDEPILWRKFYRMVEMGLDDARQAQEEISKAQKEIAPKIPGLSLPPHR